MSRVKFNCLNCNRYDHEDGWCNKIEYEVHDENLESPICFEMNPWIIIDELQKETVKARGVVSAVMRKVCTKKDTAM